MKIASLLAALTVSALVTLPAFAQSVDITIGIGGQGGGSWGQGGGGWGQGGGGNRGYSAPGGGQTVRNGLPPTSLDSFVANAGGMAEAIYGDEGVEGPPPYEEFTPMHRINAGIVGIRDAGLTTGHGSMLPNAMGGDEFVKTEAFTQAGTNAGNYQNWANGFGTPTGDYDLGWGSRATGDPEIDVSFLAGQQGNFASGAFGSDGQFLGGSFNPNNNGPQVDLSIPGIINGIGSVLGF